MTPQEMQTAVEFYKANAADSVISSMVPDATKAYDGSTMFVGQGLYQYNLLPTAATLFPVVTPLRNSTSRINGKGNNHEFKAIVGVNDQGLSSVFGQEGSSGQLVSIDTVDISNVYRSLKLAGSATFESQWVGAGFVDSKATAVVNTLRQFMIREEQAIAFAANSTANLQGGFAAGAVGACAEPTLAAIANPTGSGLTGFSSTGTLYVKITAVTGIGESQPSTEATQAWTAGQVVQVNFPARNGFPVQAYRVYTSTSTGTEKLQTTQMVYVSGLTAVKQSSGASVLIGAAGTGADVPGTDTTTSANAYNGLFAQLYGAAAAVAAGDNSGFGPVIQSANAQVTYDLLDGVMQSMWDTNRANPDWLLVESTEARALTKATIGNGVPYFLTPEGTQSSMTAGMRVAKLTNGTTSKEVSVRSHPYFYQGMAVFGSDSVPDWYAQDSDVPAPMVLNMLQDYTEVDYPPVYNTSGNGDQWVIEVVNMGTFELFAPVLFGVLDSISSGAASPAS